MLCTFRLYSLSICLKCKTLILSAQSASDVLVSFDEDGDGEYDRFVPYLWSELRD